MTGLEVVLGSDGSHTMYEGINSGVRGYYSRGTRILELGYEGIRAGLRGY